MPKRFSLDVTRYGKGSLVISKKSVREFRRYDRRQRGVALKENKLEAGNYDAEPILTPLSIRGNRFYVQPKTDGRAVIPSKIVKKYRLRAGRLQFAVRDPRSGDVVKSRGFYRAVATKNIYKTRFYLKDIESVSLPELKKKFFMDLASFPKRMISVYGRVSCAIIKDDGEILPAVFTLPTLTNTTYIENRKTAMNVISYFIDETFDKLFEILMRPYVVRIILVSTEVSHFGLTHAGEIKPYGRRKKR